MWASRLMFCLDSFVSSGVIFYWFELPWGRLMALACVWADRSSLGWVRMYYAILVACI